MLASVKSWVQQRAPFLLTEKMPVWFTILVGIAAAVVTYIVSPMLSQKLQIQNIRSAQVAKSTDGLNSQIIALSKSVRRLTDALTNNPEDAPKIRSESLYLITEMQWRLVDIRVVLDNPDDVQAIDNLSDAIRMVQDALNVAVSKKAEGRLIAAMTNLGNSTEDVLNRLYRKADLKG